MPIYTRNIFMESVRLTVERYSPPLQIEGTILQAARRSWQQPLRFRAAFST